MANNVQTPDAILLIYPALNLNFNSYTPSYLKVIFKY